MRRIDGQIWIDREAPYRLKYHINGVDYTVLVAADYEVPEGPDGQPFTILQGMVVRDSDKGPAMIEPASFPEDIDRVLGIALNSSNYEFLPDNADAKHIAVAQTGYIVLDKDTDVSGVFALASDIDASLNGWGTEPLDKEHPEDLPGIGAPVYWYIGHIDEAHDYHDSSSQAGKITFITPSGYKYPSTKIKGDETLNVGYDNLPRIGTVVDYTLSGTKITSLIININFAAFDSSLEWHWPGEHLNENCGKIDHSVGDNAELSKTPGATSKSKKTAADSGLVIRHGLFVDNPGNMEVVNYSSIVASDDIDSGPIYNIQTRAQNFTSDADRRTVFDIKAAEDLYYRVSGTIHYNFDKNHASQTGE